MTIGARIGGAVAALLLAGGVASAEEAKDAGEFHAPSEPLAIEAMHNFGQCIVDRNSKPPRAILAMDFRTEAYRQKLTKLAKGSGYCMPNSRFKTNQVLLAGGMAEALLLRDKRSADLGRYVGAEGARPIVARSASEVVAFCIVRADPKGVASIFATPPAGKDEDVAMKAIGGHIVDCVPQGQSFRVNRQGLRALLALGAYRLAAWNAGEIRS